MSPNSRQSALARWQTPLICLVLGVVTLAVYWAARRNEFLNWDDLTYVSVNDHVRGGITWANIVWAFTHSYSSNWHPLTWMSHMLDCQLFSLNPGPPHLVNVAFHITNVVLLFAFLGNTTGALWRSAFVAGLFALHPLHVESVAWLAERKDVLSTFFFLLTLLAYAAYARSRGVEQSGREEGRGKRGEKGQGSGARSPVSSLRSSVFYTLALVLFVLGLLSKPMLVTVPFVLLLLDYWPLGRLQLSFKEQKAQGAVGWDSPPCFKKVLVEKIPFFVLSLASCVVTFIAQKSGGAVAAFESLPFGARLENALVSYAAYVVKFIWPVALSPIYPHPTRWDIWRVVGSGCLLVVLSGAAWLARRRFPFVLVGWLWYLGTLVPVIGLIQVGSQAFADRYTYIPLIGIMLSLAWLLPSSSSSRTSFSFSSSKIFASFLCAVLLLFSFRTVQQVQIWQNTGTLFRHALDLAPNNVQALYGLGTYLVEQGQVEQGKQLLERAIALHRNYPEALGSMAELLDSQGKYTDAVRFYQAALDAQPDNTSALNNLAWLKTTCSDPAIRNGAEAVPLAQRACELTDYSKPIFIGTLAAAQAETGDFTSAIATAERAIAVASASHLEDTAAKNRDLISLYRQGKTATGGQPGPKR